MNKISRQMINNLISNKEIDRNDICTYFILLHFAHEINGAIIIDRTSKYTLFLRIIRSLPYFNMASLYRSFNRLEKLGFISFRKNTVFLNDDELINAFYKEKTKGYIVVPDFVLTESFYSKSLAAKKLTLKLLSMLNGDLKKAVKLDPAGLQEILRKNTVQKVRNVFEEISDLFLIEHNTISDIFEIKLNKDILDIKLQMRQVSNQSIFRRVCKAVKSTLNAFKYNYTLELLEMLVEACRTFKKKEIRNKLIKYISLDSNTEIKNLDAYFQSF
ncbi:hypothetical protein PQV03_14190 [Thermoanaerobacterium thermosaccharolyticum]|uniref:hypothetical protein n=1 Tax=Thermoanaerobacterium thermosaccharolyticum TaxID=1517 RepID=UPI003D2977D2